MKILIGGGSGFIGRYLRYFLRKGGHDVTLVSRRPGPDTLTWYDLESKGLPEGCDAVVNLAGQNLMDPKKKWNDDFKAELRSSRINTTLAMVSAISKAHKPPSVWVSASAVGYYPYSQTAEYTEESSFSNNDDYMMRLCQDWEQAADLPAASATRSVIVRIGVALGAGGGAIQAMYVPFYFGLGGPMATGKQWFPWIHVDDVANIFVHSIENKNVTGILNAVAPESATNSEFTKAFASAMWRPAFFPQPEFVLNYMFGAERAKVLTHGQKVIPKRTLDSSYEFLYPDLKSACLQSVHSRKDLAKSFKW